MRLKSLQIKGFKSFADKTVVNFDNQITGIVGPNGCGKSNIVDAIRWVIGEHKIRTLRSQSLQDLIFNGSKARSGSGLAEVSLTFENTKNLLPTEYNVITIGRKFYKNGDSEYRLNDISCRLKDITNLFMDTGISSDSYAIIELGMVDEIIKDKENSRRRMLEQAAGISIYKTRKKEAQNKLENTEQDLNRIEDLLFEIKNNVRTLENQAKKAEKYLSIKNEYKQASIEHAKVSLQDFNESYQTLNDKQKAELDHIIGLEAGISKDDAEIEKRKLQLIEHENSLQNLQKSFNLLLDKIRKQEGDKNLASQRIEHLLEKINLAEQSLKDSKNQIQQLEKNRKQTEQNVQKHKEGLDEFKNKVEDVRKRLEEKRRIYDQQKKELDALQENHQHLQIQGFDAEKLMAVSENEINNFLRSIEQIKSDNEQKSIRHTELKKQHEALEIEIRKQKEALEELEQKKAKASENILASQALLESARHEWMEENRKLDAAKNQFHLYQELIEKLEGFPESIKYLKHNAQWNVQAPLLSDVFEVEDAYTLAIENYLDKYLNYYVVENNEQAFEAISLLKKEQKGKVGFFILNQIKENTTAPIQSENKAAFDLVKCENKYVPLLKHLLQNVFIGENNEKQNNAILLSVDGTYFATENSIVGGFNGLIENNKIGRQQRLDKIKNNITSLEQSTQLSKQKMQHLQEEILGYNEELNEEKIKKLQQDVQNKQVQLARFLNESESLDQQKTQAIERIKNFEQHIETKNAQIAGGKEKYQEAKQQLSIAFESWQKGKEKFSEAEADYNRLQEEYNTQNIILTKQQSKINELETECKMLSEQIIQNEQKVSSYETQRSDTKKQQDETLLLLKDTEENLYTLFVEKENEEKNLNEKESAFQHFRNDFNEFETALNKRRREKEQAENSLSEIKDKLNEMKLQLTSLKERLFIEFKVDLDSILNEERTGNQSLEALELEVENLRKRIFNLGEVNPMAVEAYKEMKARFDFITEQRDDLLAAKEDLLQTILEIESNANQKFLDTFEQVRTNFIQVFKALFTEDDACDMKLTNPDDPAETSVEIYAQPKGKHPKTITQLSGGEKTLTSTAFLFAIYLIKPAPFCILDEVDAPLDDANVGKFMKMIRKFSDNSQFIIVTHNKQTMSMVDVIYGVTMQEAGVSKLVPVDFRSLEDNMFAN